MNKMQATEIQRHLLAIDDALRKAADAISELDREDRQILNEPLGDLVSCLHFDMLEDLVYVHYPELRPPAETPTVSDDLQWKDMTLPESVSERDIDAIIFSILTSRRQKTARVIMRAMTHCGEHGLPVDAEIFGARIQALVESDRIRGFGDLCLWDHSEVKLKD